MPVRTIFFIQLSTKAEEFNLHFSVWANCCAAPTLVIKRSVGFFLIAVGNNGNDMTEAFCKLIVWDSIFWNSAFSFCYHLGLPSCSNSLPLEIPGALAYKWKASFQVGRNLSMFPQDICTDSSLKLIMRPQAVTVVKIFTVLLMLL